MTHLDVVVMQGMFFACLIALLCAVVLFFAYPNTAEGKVESPQPLDPVAERTHMNGLISFFLAEMVKVGDQGQHINFDRIEDEQGRAEYWSFSMPPIPQLRSQIGWQQRMTSGNWSEIIITSQGEWVIMGNTYFSLYRGGEDREIAVPTLESGDILQTEGLNGQSASAIREGIKVLLAAHSPSSLTQFDALQRN